MDQRQEEGNRSCPAHEPVLPRSRAWQWRMPAEWTPLSCKLAPKDLSFTPLSIYSHLPSKLPSTADNKKLSAIFSPENIHSLGVEVFYIWPPKGVPGRPLLLVPSGRLLALFEDLCSHLPDSIIQLPSAPDTIGLINDFAYHPHIYPRYLGYIRSQESYLEIISRDKHDAIPSRGLLPRGEERNKHHPEREVLETYIQTYERIKRLLASREPLPKTMEKSTSHKDAGSIPHVRNPTASQKSIERALGLRPAKINIDVSKGETWAELEAAEKARIAAVKRINELGPIDVELPPPYEKEVAPVFIAFDVECYEEDHTKITEIGIAIVDTAELNDCPGAHGHNWYSKIRSRHFLIENHRHLVNKKYVQGCPNHFDFGFSEGVTLKDAPRVIASCFRHPSFGESQLNASASHESSTLKAGMTSDRKIVAVGHDPGGDLKWLSRLGINVQSMPGVEKNVVDTKYLYRDMTQEKEFKSLAHVLEKFNIPAWNLHNAGNDATLTMQAMIAIAVTSAAERGTSAQLVRIQNSRSEEEEKAAFIASKSQVAGKAKARLNPKRTGTGGETVTLDHSSGGDHGPNLGLGTPRGLPANVVQQQYEDDSDDSDNVI